MAQQSMPTPDTTPRPHTRKHRRPIQPWRFLHLQTAQLAGTRTTDQPTTHNHQEDHWRFYFCSWHWLYTRPIHPTIPTTSITETLPKEPFGGIDLIPGEEVYTHPTNLGPSDQRLESRWRCLVRSTATGMDRRRVIWIPYPIVTVEPIYFEVFDLKIRIFELRFLKRIRHRETTPTPFDGGHEPKSNLYPSQGEKVCAACLLMIKLYLKDTCSDCCCCCCWPCRCCCCCPCRCCFNQSKPLLDPCCWGHWKVQPLTWLRSYGRRPVDLGCCVWGTIVHQLFWVSYFGSVASIKKEDDATLPETNIFALENSWWRKMEFFHFMDTVFSRASC